jgi:hypothetical protein
MSPVNLGTLITALDPLDGTFAFEISFPLKVLKKVAV